MVLIGEVVELPPEEPPRAETEAQVEDDPEEFQECCAEPHPGPSVEDAEQPSAPRDPPSQEQTQAAEAALAAAEALKQEGNQLYGQGCLEEAMDRYTRAVEAAPAGAAKQRAVYLANRAACHLRMGAAVEAARDCGEALDLDPGYAKALARRAAAYEALDDLERALVDAQKVLELEPSNAMAARQVARLAPVVEERREKLKAEMIDKLKELGNSLLGKFGMSLDNFKMEKDPATGGYSLKMSH